jgi:apolipoprotein N-acyltransferase
VQKILSLHFDLEDAALAKQPADLLVWSETMLPTYFPADGDDRPDDPPRIREDRAAIRTVLGARVFGRHRLPLIAGVVTYDGPFEDPLTPLRNSVLLLDQTGKRVAAYDKKVPVPGGEYLPWIDWFPKSVADDIRRRVYELAGFLPNLAPGQRSGIFDLATVGRTGKAGLSICFEFAYPHVGRELVKEGCDFLLNLSNEAWFPDSAEFAQSTAMSVFRSVETRRTLVRCANSGTSGWIDPWGRTNFLEQDGRRDGFAGTLLVAPPLSTTVTPYVRFGEWLGIVCWAIAVAGLLASRLRRKPPAS